ncbi:MAG: oligosaccharide flippase family protein [Thermodesulfobacteriota bacterium]
MAVSIKQLLANPLTQRLLTAVSWNTTGTVALQALGLAATILVARLLGPADFGRLSLLQATVTMFSVVAALGLPSTATKCIAELRFQDRAEVGRIIGFVFAVGMAFSAIVGVAMLSLAPVISYQLLHSPDLEQLLMIGTLLMLLTALSSLQTGILAGFEAFRAMALVNLLGGILRLGFAGIGTYYWGLSGALWALICSTGLICAGYQTAIASVTAAASVDLSLRCLGRHLRLVYDFSLPCMLSTSLVAPINWLSIVILATYAADYNEVGIYNAANQWFLVVLFFPSIVGQSMLPIVSEQLCTAGRGAARTLLLCTLKMLLVIIVPVVIVGTLLSPLLMGLYGTSFQHGWPALVILFASAGFAASAVPLGYFLIASAELWTGFFLNLVWAISFVGLALFLANYGAVGLASARCAAYSVLLVLALVVVNRHPIKHGST